MMKNMIFGGYLIDDTGFRHQLPLVKNPSDVIIRETIKEVSCAARGVVELEYKTLHRVGPDKLTMYVDRGNLLLMLGVNEEDGDYSVRTLTNGEMPNDLMVIMGERYPAKAVTRDIDLACAAFHEFAQFADVPLMR